MKGSQQVIDALNAGLTIELTAINQYFIGSKMCRDWGFDKLATHFHAESMEEMKHAELLIDRVLFLDGTPEIARYDTIRVGQDVKQQLENGLALEIHAVETYNGAIQLTSGEGDTGSREIMERILIESEESVDWLETQLSLIDQIGLENYLTMQLAGNGGQGGGE